MNYNEWELYFQQNQSHFREIDFSMADELTEKELSVIRKSIQQFQHGENSEGKHLFAFAKTHTDPAYLRCISLFIREEQSHARVLGAFMDRHNVPRIRSHWVDGIFRWMRKSGGLENTIRILLTAEIISKVYYAALYNATGSKLLKRICHQILKDEDEHITFQCDTLSQFFNRRRSFFKLISECWSFTLITGTALVVWIHHSKVLKKGNYSFGRFFSSVLHVFFESEARIRATATGISVDNKMIPA